MKPNDSTASVLSEGDLWIIVAVAVLAIGGLAALFVVKRDRDRQRRTVRARKTKNKPERILSYEKAICIIIGSVSRILFSSVGLRTEYRTEYRYDGKGK